PVDQATGIAVEDGLHVAATEAEILTCLPDGAKGFVDIERVVRFHLRRLAVLVEVERIIRAIDIRAAVPLTPAAHVKDRVIGAVKDPPGAEGRKSEAVNVRVQYRRVVEVESFVVRQLR